MEKEIVKNKDGSFSFKHTIEIVKLEDLEQELINIIKLKEEADNFNAWIDTLPDNKKIFI